MSQFLIQARNVVKSYGRKVVLHNISLEVQGPTLFGLLGPNGAGKTTFIKSLLNLVKIDKGEILLNGLPPQNENSRQNLSYLPEKFSFYPYYSIRNALSFFAQMHGLSKEKSKELIESTLKKINLESIGHQKLSTLSKGQLQRVGLGKLLISQADFLILDEPFSGLDPIGIKELKDLLLELRQQGKTIFINSHILSEVEQICDEVAILKEGQILAQGRVKEIVKKGSLESYFYQAVKGSEKMNEKKEEMK